MAEWHSVLLKGGVTLLHGSSFFPPPGYMTTIKEVGESSPDPAFLRVLIITNLRGTGKAIDRLLALQAAQRHNIGI